MIGAAVGDVEPAIGQITDPRREPEPEQMAKAEDMFGRAARIGVVLFDSKRHLMVKKAIKNMERLARIGRNDFGVERRVAVRDVGIELDAGLRTVTGIVLGTGFAVTARPEELAVRR